jgi:hypothetical protein
MFEHGEVPQRCSCVCDRMQCTRPRDIRPPTWGILWILEHAGSDAIGPHVAAQSTRRVVLSTNVRNERSAFDVLLCSKWEFRPTRRLSSVLTAWMNDQDWLEGYLLVGGPRVGGRLSALRCLELDSDQCSTANSANERA